MQPACRSPSRSTTFAIAFASVMIERGLSPTVLAHVIGHRDATVTQRVYVHLFNRQKTDDAVRLAMESALS